MLRTLRTALLSTLTLLCFSALLAWFPWTLAAQREGKATAAEPATIKVRFDGLMVFHKIGDQYEVGILSKDAALRHHFAVVVDPDPGTRPKLDDARIEELKTLGNSWVLEVEKGSGSARRTVAVRDTGSQGSLADTDSNKEDFRWMIDLEGKQFHDQELKLRKGKLTPIIQVSGGEFTSEYKSGFLRRKKGFGRYQDFGFMAETITLTVNLQDKEELVLKVQDKGVEGEAFRLKAGVPCTVEIANAPMEMKMPNQKSHFRLYYRLFKGMPIWNQYEIQNKKDGPKPKNPFPGEEAKFRKTLLMTFDNQACGAVRLGLRTDRLY